MKFRSNLGFTLIELVIVISILGIIVATALPKFINISSSAKASALDNVAGVVLSTDSLVMSKANVKGVVSTNQVTNIPGTELYILGKHMSITPEHLHNALHVDGFTMVDYGSSSIPSTFIYLGDEVLTIAQIRNAPCYVHLSRTYNKSWNEEEEFTNLNVTRRYQGC